MKKNISSIIEISNVHVKFYQFKHMRNGPILSSFAVKSISQYTDEEIVEIITDLFHSYHIEADSLSLVIPRRLVILKQMQLPSKNKEEIREMVELQLMNKIPYPVEDISYYCYLLDDDSADHSRVLVIIMHKEVSDRYLKIFNQAGVALSRMTLSSFGILEWLEFQKRKKNISAEGPKAIIDIDIDCSEICFCHDGKLLFSRNFDGGARDLNQDNVTQLAKQIELSLGMYQKEQIGPPIKETIILSTLPETKLLKEKLEHVIQTPTKVFMPVEKVLYQRKLKFSVAEEQPGISLSVGLGLGSANMKKIINLTPQKVHDTKRGKIKRRMLIKFITLLLITCALGVSIPGLDLYRKMNYLNELKSEVDDLKPRASDALRQMKFIEMLNKEFGKRVYMSDLMVELYDLTPTAISFRSLDLNERGHLTIAGYADASGSINDFQAALMKSSTFIDVNLQSATKRRILNKEVMDFKIDTQLTVAQEKRQ